jgi:hypothetical protein
MKNRFWRRNAQATQAYADGFAAVLERVNGRLGTVSTPTESISLEQPLAGEPTCRVLTHLLRLWTYSRLFSLSRSSYMENAT